MSDSMLLIDYTQVRFPPAGPRLAPLQWHLKFQRGLRPHNFVPCHDGLPEGHESWRLFRRALGITGGEHPHIAARTPHFAHKVTDCTQWYARHSYASGAGKVLYNIRSHPDCEGKSSVEAGPLGVPRGLARGVWRAGGPAGQRAEKRTGSTASAGQRFEKWQTERRQSMTRM